MVVSNPDINDHIDGNKLVCGGNETTRGCYTTNNDHITNLISSNDNFTSAYNPYINGCVVNQHVPLFSADNKSSAMELRSNDFRSILFTVRIILI